MPHLAVDIERGEKVGLGGKPSETEARGRAGFREAP